jgi:hypothetical protein
MAVIGSTYNNRFGYNGMSTSMDNQTSNSVNMSPSMVYASDGTAIYVDLEMYNSSPYVERFTLFASAEGNPKTSYKTHVITNNYTTTTAYSWTFSNTDNLQANTVVIDREDNVYVVLIGSGASGTTAGAIYFLKYSKPAEGWRAWVNGSSTSLGTAFTPGADTTGIAGSGSHVARYLKGAWYTNSGHIVVMSWYSGGSLQNVFRLYCLTTGGSMVSSSVWGGGSTTGVAHISSVQFGRGSQLGGIWYNQGTAASTDQVYFRIWQVTDSGVISSSEPAGKLFGITLDSYNAGMYRIGRITSTFFKDNKLVSIARSSGANQYYLRVDQVSQTARTTSLLQSDTTYSVQPAGSYSAISAASGAVYLQPFPEEDFVRIWTVDNSGNFGYLDAFINPSTNQITFDTQSYSIGSLGSSYGSLYTNFSVPQFGRYYDFIDFPTNSTTRFNSNLTALPTGKTWAGYTTGPLASSFRSPSVTTLNMQGGIKFNIVPVGMAGGRGSTHFGRPMVSSVVSGYKIRRAKSGTNTYYNATTRTWDSSEVVNSNTATSFTVDIPASAGFDASGVYDFALSLVDIYSEATPYGTLDSITSTDSSAPLDPTAARFMRKTLIADTDAHEYTFDTNALINKITVANAGTSSTVFSMKVGEYYLVAPVTIVSGGTLNVDTSQRVDANDRILFSSTNTQTDVYISGTIGI